MDEPNVVDLEVGCKDNICKLTHKCHKESYENDIKYHMNKTTILSAVNMIE